MSPVDRVERASFSASVPAAHETSEELQQDWISTAAAAKLMGLTPASLRNYAWLQSLIKRERIARALQEPPTGMPRPRRVRGRLKWKLQEVNSFVEKKRTH